MLRVRTYVRTNVGTTPRRVFCRHFSPLTALTERRGAEKFNRTERSFCKNEARAILLLFITSSNPVTNVIPYTAHLTVLFFPTSDAVFHDALPASRQIVLSKRLAIARTTNKHSVPVAVKYFLSFCKPRSTK